LEKAGADAVRDAVEIQEGQEIDGFEFAVDGGRAAQACGDIEVSAEEARRMRRIRGCAG
jgi:hypothetical protein